MRPVVGGLQAEFPDTFRFESFDFDVQERRIEAIERYGLGLHPSFAFVAPDGTIIDRLIVPVPDEVLRERVLALINASARP